MYPIRSAATIYRMLALCASHQMVQFSGLVLIHGLRQYSSVISTQRLSLHCHDRWSIYGYKHVLFHMMLHISPTGLFDLVEMVDGQAYLANQISNQHSSC